MSAPQPSLLIPGTEKQLPTARFYRPELDVLRFIAFLSVFLHHGTMGVLLLEVPTQAFRMGMCLFFLLSAYLITELLLKEEAKTGTINIRAFYTRRALRIWPLYFFCLLLAGGVGVLAPRLRMRGTEVIAYLLFAGNWYNIIFGPMKSPWALLWSLTVEEQFYLTWPWVARFGRRALLVASLATLPIAAITLVVLMNNGHRTLDMEVWSNSFFQFAFFGVGALLALWFKGRQLTTSLKWRAILTVTAGALFLFSGFLLVRNQYNPVVARGLAAYSIVAVACVTLFCATLGIDPKWLPARLLRLGRISYGLYMFHGPVQFFFGYLVYQFVSKLHLQHPKPTAVLINLTFSFGITVVLAELSYRFLEKPFLRVKERFELVRSRPA